MTTSYFMSLQLMLLLIIAYVTKFNVAALNLGSSGNIVCLGQPQAFLCEVQKQGSLPRLQWRIHFESSPSVRRMTQRFTADDPEGTILRDNRPGVSFEFSLSSNSNSSSNLTSVMTVTVDDINGTALISNATVDCEGDEDYPITLHVNEGLTPSPIVMNSIDQDLMTIRWNSVDRIDHYIISVADNESEISYTTFNTTIQLPLQYNRDYNVSVTANSCAGNSTATEMNLRVGYCTLSSAGLSKMAIEGNGSAVEGSQISLHCHDSDNQSVVEAICMKTGDWRPNPHAYMFMCHRDKKNDTEVVAKDLNPKMETWDVVTVLIVVIISILIVLVILSTIMALTVYRKNSSKKAIINHPNYYSDLSTSMGVNSYSENQELGIYSLLQPEEQAVTRLQSKDQTAALVYADVGSTLSRNPKANANISLQLDDDCVQYADLKHHQTSELHQRECNSHADTPVDLDSLLIHLRSEVTPKWHQFGEAVGISEEILKKYSNYPPEECIVEVLDYWLRNHPSTDKPTWRDAANILTEIDLHQLADRLLQSGAPMPVDMNAVPEHLLQLNLQSSDEIPPPLPPKMADLDEEMMSSESATKLQPKCGSEETLN